MLNRLLILIIGIALFGCVSKKKQEAAGLVADLFKAESSTIGVKNKANSETGLSDVLELTMINLKAVSKEYEHDKITSLAALGIYQNITSEELSDFDEINIKVENYGEKYEKNYSIKDLDDVDNNIAIVKTFMNSHRERDEKEFKILFDNLISDSLVMEVYNTMSEIDSCCGSFQNITVTGFGIDEIKTEDTLIPVIIIWFESYHNEMKTDYKLKLSRKNKKIVSITLN